MYGNDSNWPVQCQHVVLIKQLCHGPLVFPLYNPLYLPRSPTFPPVGSITQPPLNQLLHTYSLPDCRCIMRNPPAIFSRQISWYLTCLLPLTTSSRLCPNKLTCPLFLDFASAHFLSACCLPGLPLPRFLPHQNLDFACCPDFLIVVCLDS